MKKAIGYAAPSANGELRPMNISRRDPASNEVSIDILFCAICHSDIHQARNEWKNTIYPCMPGHEIVGRVAALGGAVRRYKVGDLVGVGCMLDCCHKCKACKEGMEQYCEKGCLGTYNGNLRNPSEENQTYGGYSDSIVVREDFVLRMPANLKPEAAAPLMCAGVTTYSAMKHGKVGEGTSLGIVGLGGLGQMAVKLGRAMGATVSVITKSPEMKKSDAMRMGAGEVIDSTSEREMKACAGKFDFLLSTIPQPHDPNSYMALLKRDGVYMVVGCLAPLTVPPDMGKMALDRKSLGSSLIGSIRETQEVLEFCSKHNIVSEIKMISVDEINDCYKKIDAGEADFRYVIDMSTLKGKMADDTLTAKVAL